MLKNFFEDQKVNELLQRLSEIISTNKSFILSDFIKQPFFVRARKNAKVLKLFHAINKGIKRVGMCLRVYNKMIKLCNGILEKNEW